MQLCDVGMYQTLNIQSVYFMTWTNYAAFSIGLFTNPCKSEKMHHHGIFSKSIDIACTCFTKMVEAWELLCKNTIFSAEGRLLLINNCLKEFYMVCSISKKSILCIVYYTDTYICSGTKCQRLVTDHGHLPSRRVPKCMLYWKKYFYIHTINFLSFSHSAKCTCHQPWT